MANVRAARERRLAQRVPVRQAVRLLDSWRHGWRRTDVALLDVSLLGCRLVAPSGAIDGAHVWLFLPSAWSGGWGLPLRGDVAWRQPLPGGEAGLSQAGIRFARMPVRARCRLERALAEMLHADDPATAEDPGAAGADEDERRRTPRHGYGHRVIVRGQGRPRVLLARDLSAGGMRVSGGGDLARGDELAVALHVGDGSIPLVLGARVVRHHVGGEAALAFEHLTPRAAEHLEKMIATLPPLRCGQGEAVYLSEILPGSSDGEA